ncbi:MAG: 23S rRNA (adenine(2503)-C(2))-methyltransferase RlmN [Lentisphaeria bacterium]|nr:23S rRNA (adenine(2503)-C(2))-methyltransferase RlmN [Lentisphaeria bacterium]NQZ67035.1 23S rRNA (adenine(2503)-C(2))-methyltransferase RlmN [Lentisphaeria bacterium]
MDSKQIEQIIEDEGIEKYRAEQIRQAIFQEHASSFNGITTLKKDLRERLSEKYPLLSFELYRLFESSDKTTFKALLKLSDGKIIETVLMNPKPGHWTTCISSQVGCALACTFCATGTMGLLRNLRSEEITDQVLFWRQFIGERKIAERLNNVVYMGMGEPFQNTKNVFDSLDELMNPDTFHMGARHLSVSTAGIVKPIYQMADRFPQVNLALSLHIADDEKRTELMPINKAWPLAKLAEALTDYIEKTHRKVFIEYILLRDETDKRDNAKQLIKYLKTIKPTHLVHVNLIVYNETESSHKQTSKDHARWFKNYLEENGISATIRKNLGRDIDGACGQLVVQQENI